jgi:HD superfamily phosphodiesterase
MNISDIYTKYKIMPSLQLHMFRVAGVAAVICDSATILVDRHSIISAALLHDMGNIIKFKMDIFPEFLKPEGREYWQNVQNEYFEKYGHDEHVATLEIAKESGANKQTMELLNRIGFSKANLTYESVDFNLKIASYADMRVEPHGVVALEKRMNDGRERNRTRQTSFSDDSLFEEMSEYLKKIEKQIFEITTIKPDEISDDSISGYTHSLVEFEI